MARFQEMQSTEEFHAFILRSMQYKSQQFLFNYKNVAVVVMQMKVSRFHRHARTCVCTQAHSHTAPLTLCPSSDRLSLLSSNFSVLSWFVEVTSNPRKGFPGKAPAHCLPRSLRAGYWLHPLLSLLKLLSTFLFSVLHHVFKSESLLIIHLNLVRQWLVLMTTLTCSSTFNSYFSDLCKTSSCDLRLCVHCVLIG